VWEALCRLSYRAAQSLIIPWADDVFSCALVAVTSRLSNGFHFRNEHFGEEPRTSLVRKKIINETD
jgi:hypothetical protein